MSRLVPGAQADGLGVPRVIVEKRRSLGRHRNDASDNKEGQRPQTCDELHLNLGVKKLNSVLTGFNR